MVRLQILSGKMAGTEKVVRHFPFAVGRSAKDFSIDEPGVFNRHFSILLDEKNEFVARAEENSFITLNGERVENSRLRNGDLIEIGQLKIRFGLSATTQRSLLLRETATWIFLGTLSFGQVALIYWLLQF